MLIFTFPTMQHKKGQLGEYLTDIDRFKNKTDLGKRIYKRRKETIERAFADLKELHGFRYARFRGVEKMQEQCLLIF